MLANPIENQSYRFVTRLNTKERAAARPPFPDSTINYI